MFLTVLLRILWQKSYDINRIPSTHKHAIITLILKKNHHIGVDMRPVAGLTNFSKTLDHTFHEQIMDNFGTNNLLSDH